MRLVSILGASILLTLPVSAHAEPQRGAATSTLTLEKLLAQFRSMKGLEAKFREEKRIAMLDAPLVSEGTLHFSVPDRLLRTTAKPTKTRMLIDGAKLTFNDGHTTESMSLDANPVAKLFVDSFLKILVGDTAALSRLYEMTFKPGAGELWELSLKPKVDPMNKVISVIELSGSGRIITKMRIAEIGGDETLTTYTGVDTSRTYAIEEQKKLFTATSP
jgi:outer membrane lipoprotein-sorting protein